MLVQKFKASLRFIGILLLRSLLGIVVGYVWLFAVAYLFHIVMDVRFPRDMFDHFYDSGPPREGRYGGRAGEVYGFAWQFGFKGFWVWFTVGILWGFSQGKLDIQRFLRKRHTLKNRHLYFGRFIGGGFMFLQKFKTSLGFLGILSMRVLLGFVAGFLWLAFAAFISRNMVGWMVEKVAYRDLDGSYNSIAEASQRYDSMMAQSYDFVASIGWIGGWICLAIGILWGFSQGRLDLRKWLRRQHT